MVPVRRAAVVLAAAGVVALAAGGAGLGAGLVADDLAASAPAAPFALPTGRQQPFGDSGSASDVAAVRATVQAAFDAEQVAAALRDDRAPALSHAQRIALLSRDHSGPQARELAAALEAVSGERPFLRSGRFVVEQWQGVLVEGERAKAFVAGHDEVRQIDGTPWRDASQQARLLLRRSAAGDHGWLVERVIASPLEG